MSPKKWKIQGPDGVRAAIPFNYHTKNMCIFSKGNWNGYLLYVLENSTGQPKPSEVFVAIGSRGSRGPAARMIASKEMDAADML